MAGGQVMEAEIAAGGRVLVHCGGGKGRAGTILACWLVLHGLDAFCAGRNEHESAPKMSAGEAVRTIRDRRPGSLESNAQHDFVWAFSRAVWKEVEAKDASGPAADAAHVSDDSGSRACQNGLCSTLQQPAEVDTVLSFATTAPTPLNHLCTSAPPQFPRTAHMHLSPGFTDDDVFLSKTLPSWDEVVISEKLDGGNCCIFMGQVFARSHAHETSLPWFSAAKQLAQHMAVTMALPDHIALFVENLEAVHSIDYGHVASPVYVIGAMDLARGNSFLSWDAVVLVAERVNLPVGDIHT